MNGSPAEWDRQYERHEKRADKDDVLLLLKVAMLASRLSMIAPPARQCLQREVRETEASTPTKNAMP